MHMHTHKVVLLRFSSRLHSYITSAGNQMNKFTLTFKSSYAYEPTEDVDTTTCDYHTNHTNHSHKLTSAMRETGNSNCSDVGGTNFTINWSSHLLSPFSCLFKDLSFFANAETSLNYTVNMNANDDSNVEVAEHSGDSPTMEGNTSVTFSSPLLVTRPDNNWQSGTDNGGASDRKRSRRAMADDGALDDIMGQSKLRSFSYSVNIFANFRILSS